MNRRLAAVLLAFLSLLAAPGAFAQKAAIVKNLDERGRAPYQQSLLFVVGNCSFNSVIYTCNLDLPAVPAGKRLVLEHISLFAALNSGSLDSLAILRQVGLTLFHVQPAATQRVINAQHFYLDRPVLVFFDPEDVPKIRLTATGPVSSANVTVHGYLIDASN